MALLSYIITTVLYCIVLYTINCVPQPNETKYFLSFVLILTPIKPDVYTTTDTRTISYNTINTIDTNNTHAVTTTVRCSVNYNTTSTTGKYVP